MRFTKFLLYLLLTLQITSASTFAEEPSINGTLKADPVFQQDGLAIRGYDAVAFFTQEKAVKGKKEHAFDYQNATWLFASQENKDVFAKEPEKYMPQYGGYCAYGMSSGYAAPIDPKAWSILDGKLYLNYNLDVRKEWSKDTKGHIQKADTNWPKIPKK